ncbi:hypothetical protein NL676_018537 [Syzygium grande]|nr:hypothetical protein NL676_018537 [Syzygium grande]
MLNGFATQQICRCWLKLSRSGAAGSQLITGAETSSSGYAMVQRRRIVASSDCGGSSLAGSITDQQQRTKTSSPKQGARLRWIVTEEAAPSRGVGGIRSWR